MLPTNPPAPDAEPWRFALEIWPATASTPWHAVLWHANAQESIRFEQPMQLLLYVTRPLGGGTATPRGLR